MRTLAVQVYKFNELEDDIKEKILNNFREFDYYFWADENKKTLKEFERHFPVKVKDFEYGYRNYINAHYYIDDCINDLRGVRLRTYIINNFGNVLFKKKHLNHIKGKSYYSKIQTETSCVLTGYCIDDAILEPLYNFIKKPNNHESLQDVLYDCLQSWVFACNKDYEYLQSDEAIIEHIEANEYEFYENGNIA